MSLLSFCHWLARTHVSIAMRDSTYGFAAVEIGHLLALAIFGGAVILVDLRLLGLGFKSQPAAEVAKDLLPLTAGGVVIMLFSGVLLFISGPVRYYHNPAFQLKMWAFLAAIVVHFILQVRVAKRTSILDQNPVWVKGAALASLLLWLTVGLAGRAIGYV